MATHDGQWRRAPEQGLGALHGPPAAESDTIVVPSGMSGAALPSVLVVVPTHNSARTIEACLRSLRDQSYPCRIAVVDNFSTDETPMIARLQADYFLQAGPERCRQRNVGAALGPAEIVGFVDSDMALEHDVIAQVVAAVDQGSRRVTVPERSFGEGFWAAVRAAERAYYQGSQAMEAPRFFCRSVFEEAGGFDEEMDAAEDWDLDIRTRHCGPAGRTSAMILHDEGSPSYLALCRKKAAYAAGIGAFIDKHGALALRRFASRTYLRRPWRLFAKQPLVGCGIVALKGGELVAVLLRFGKSVLSSAR